MRILASNPDTIGDLVLRQPLYRALIDAGHELTLIVRPSAVTAAELVAPGATLLVLPAEVYGGVDDHWEQFTPIVQAARAALPDLLLIAPYQWTRFEERLASELPTVPTAGMTGHLFPGDPHAGTSPISTLRFDRVAAVSEELPEAEKNAALGDLIGVPLSQNDPSLSPSPQALDDARRILIERGLSPETFWLTCVSGTAHVPIKAWPPERWSNVLEQWATQFGRKFLFIGLPQEREMVEVVRARMPHADTCSAVWMEADGALSTLLALAALSRGYVGHDTGPMHLAAAAGKPVLALFGGGHGLRFAPRVSPSIVLTVAVPCAGCGWACSFSRSHCVKDIPATEVLRAIEDLEAGRVGGRETRLLELPLPAQDEMIRFAGQLARDRLRETGAVRIELGHARDAEVNRADDLALQLTAAWQQKRDWETSSQQLSSEAAELVRQLSEREQTVLDLRTAIDAANERTRVEAEARRQEVAGLREHIDTARKESAGLKEQLAVLTAVQPEAPAARVKKSWREVAVDLVCGERHYTPRTSVSPMPKILLATRLTANNDVSAARRTIESALNEHYPHLEYVLIAETGALPQATAYGDRVARVVPATMEPFGAMAEAFSESQADLIAWLDVGQAYEPGALMRIGEYFRDHSLAFAAAFEQTEQRGGWQLQVARLDLDVASLRRTPGPLAAHIVFRRQAASLLGSLDPGKGAAAGWDLAIRFARRFGIRQGYGQSICTHAAEFANVGAACEAESTSDFTAAALSFETSFGWPGRVRTAMTHGIARAVRALAHRHRNGIRNATFSFDTAGLNGNFSNDYRAADVDPGILAISPISHRRPDRLLFSSPDVTSGAEVLHRVYYDRTGDCAVAFPPVSSAKLDELYARRAALAKSPIEPSPGAASAFQGYAGGRAWVRWLETIPSPYWRLTGRSAGGESVVSRIISLVGRRVANDASLRALVVGCYDGAVLDDLRQSTQWRLAGIETNAVAGEISRSKGHRVWHCSAQDAFMTLPQDELFDVIVVPAMLEHWVDPAWVLRRLMRVLSPAGRLIIRTPNLDSLLADRFGPTWWNWQLPYHRTLLGRRGLRQLASACDLLVETLRTETDAYTTAASVQVNELGLAGVVPEGSAFPDKIASRGTKLAGWARLFWDRFGRGDEMWVVLRPK